MIAAAKKIFLISFIIAIASTAALAFEPFVPTDPIMRASEVRRGMKGHALTVVRGHDPVSFPIEVIDVISGRGAPKTFIMIRASGPIIKATGGIAAGMSGSPVYINGKLIGAIGYGWEFADHDLGLVTSIDDMLNIWDNRENVPSFAPAPIIPDAPPSSDDEGTRKISTEEILALFRGSLSEDIASNDLASPLFVSGLSSASAKKIADILGRTAMPMGGSDIGEMSHRTKYGAKLRPGDAIGSLLVWGDVQIGSIGTVTAVDRDGRFIGFAHPFTLLGSTSAALSEAEISTVVPSLSHPFKFGRTGDLIGIITQDRPEGIGGRVGTFAPAASCTINVHDIDTGRKFTRRFQMMNDPFVISRLATESIAGVVEDLWGRSGGGSAHIKSSFFGSAMPNGWSRSNIFVSDEDVVAVMMQEISALTSIFALNQFQELRPFGMEIDVELTSEPRIVYIDDVKVPDGPFAPGETVSFDVTLRPWRKPPFSREYSLVIPESVSGICQLMVRGGGIAEEEAEYTEAGWRGIGSLPVLLRELDARETNGDMVLEIRGQEDMSAMIKRAQSGDPSALMNEKLKSEMRDEKEEEGSMRVIKANSYVAGLIQKLIKVDSSSRGSDAEEEEIDGE